MEGWTSEVRVGGKLSVPLKSTMNPTELVGPRNALLVNTECGYRDSEVTDQTSSGEKMYEGEARDTERKQECLTVG